MLAEIVTIGDELCRGEIVDTNSAWLAARLWDLDVTVAWMTSCADRAADIRAALTAAAGRADLVLVSGGLGPTEDDLTVDVVSEMLGVAPEIHEPSRAWMQDRFAAANYRLTPNNLRQVRAPGGAAVLFNPVGLAPGFEVALAPAEGASPVPVVCLPGVPSEVMALFDAAVSDRVIALRESRGQVERIARRTYRVFGTGESHVAAALEGVLDGVAGASLHYQAKFPEVLVKIVIRDPDRASADGRLAGVDARVRQRLGARIYGVDGDSLPAALGRALAAAGATLSCAESCTGGLVGALVTEVPGSSAYFAGGAVTYSNAEKVRQLGVSEATLAAHGAVSEACVVEMARGARDRLGTDYAVAVSGVAGPDGGTEDKPVGTVWLAVAGPAGCQTRHMRWPGDRARVRTLAAHTALSMVLAAVTAGRDPAP